MNKNKKFKTLYIILLITIVGIIIFTIFNNKTSKINNDNDVLTIEESIEKIKLIYDTKNKNITYEEENNYYIIFIREYETNKILETFMVDKKSGEIKKNTAETNKSSASIGIG